MIINLIFDQSNAPASFTSRVTSAALMLERAITDPITVTIEVGYGLFPTDQSPITGGAAEAEPNGTLAASFSYSDVLSALTVSAAAIGDTNFDALPVSSSVTGYDGLTTSAYSNVQVWSAEAKALGFIPANQSGVDGYVGFATDIPANALIGVALHELGHALGRVPNGLPFDNNIPDIFDLFRFSTASDTRLVVDSGGSAPPAYFSVNGPVNNGGTALANWGETSDPSDFLSGSQTINDPFDEFYVPGATFQSLTQLDLIELDTLGFNTITATFSWTSAADGDFASASTWTSGGTSPATSAPPFNDNVLITQGGTSYTVSSLADQKINSLVMAAGATLDIVSGVFTIDNGTNFYTTSGIIEVSGGATLILDGEVVNAGTIDAAGGTIELSGTITGTGDNVISSGGTLLVALGGSAASMTVNSGGTEIIRSGGTDRRRDFRRRAGRLRLCERGHGFHRLPGRRERRHCEQYDREERRDARARPRRHAQAVHDQRRWCSRRRVGRDAVLLHRK